MSTDAKVILITIVSSVAILAGAVLLVGRNSPSQAKVLGTSSMQIDQTSADLGNMKVSDERSATFTVTNTSNSILRLYNVSTSCDCTFATIDINGVKTGEFNMTMHMSTNLKNWIGEVKPGDKATLTAIYRPKVMPVSGPITRSVFFSTNDPANPKVEITLKANVI